MSGGRTSMGPQRAVNRVEGRGKNTVLVLECGHRKLHNPKAPVPVRPHCIECPMDDE